VPRSPSLPASAAGLALVLSLAAMVLIGPIMASLGQLGLIVMQVGALLLPAWLVAHVSDGAPVDLLGLRRPSARVLAGSLIIGATFWLINAVVIVPLSVKLAGDEGLVELGHELLGVPLPLLLVSQALAPAVCEELLFRGAVARALDSRFGRVVAIVVSALIFGLIHWPLARVLPATATGLLLAFVALRSRSTIAGMVIHFLNNAIALSLAQSELEPATSPLALGGAAAAVVAGLVLVGRK